MANVITELLFLSRELTTQLAERSGTEVVQSSKTVVLDLTKQKAHRRKLWNIFCPNAKEPKLEVANNLQGKNAGGVSFRFKDGNVPLSGASMQYRGDGQIDLRFNVVDSATQVEKISASGSYNPTQKFFDTNNWGEAIEHRFGSTSASLDSSGFNIRATINDQAALNVINQIKNFFTKPAASALLT